MKLFGWNALKSLRILSDWSSLLCFACFERFVPHLTSSKIWQPFWGCSLNYWRWSMGVSQSIRVNQDIPHVGMCCPPCVASSLHFGCWLTCLILQSLKEVALSTKKRVMPGALSVECWEDGGADIGNWQLNISRMTRILSSQCQQTNWNLFCLCQLSFERTSWMAPGLVDQLSAHPSRMGLTLSTTFQYFSDTVVEEMMGRLKGFVLLIYEWCHRP